MGKWNRFLPGLACALALVLPTVRTEAQTSLRQRRIVSQINRTQLERLSGNIHPFARSRFDRGAAPADLPMDRMLLVLKRSSQQEASLQQLLDAQQDPSSPEYHKWLTPEEFGNRFGAADSDLETVTSWLQGEGFRVSSPSAGKTVIEFSGTARQVRSALHTEIRKFVVNGEQHWANATDPQIPAALAPVVAGVSTLHNFTKQTQLSGSPQVFEARMGEGGRPELTSGDTHALAPGDFATIYNVNPLYQASSFGFVRTIAVVGRTNINLNDVTQFNTAFGSQFRVPNISLTGPDPGNLGGAEEAEAVLDATWAAAVGRNVNVQLIVSKSTNTTDGVDLSEMYIINRNFADVMTESFGDCEANFTQAQAALYSSLAEQGAAQGITYVVASGDSGSAGCSPPTDNTSNGALSVNLLASNPYVTAVGGTQLSENGNTAQYWNSTNTTNLNSSVISYIPENVWNESCSIPTGSHPCTDGGAPALWAGGGGASVFYPKPSWQSGVPGIPNDGRRDLPDVSLTAAAHDPYLVCLRGSCVPNSRGLISLYGFAGTSAATPSLAGILALALGRVNGRMGSINYALYKFAAAEDFGQCNGSNPAGFPGSNCIFNDVTVGSNAVPGVESGSYQANFGYDLATGLGSVNATNLANALVGNNLQGGHMSVSATDIDFGTVYLGDSQTRDVLLTNTGTSNLTIRQFGLAPAGTPFSTRLSCGFTIVPGASCTLSIKFKPTVVSYSREFLGFTTSDSSNPFQQIAVSGTGAASSTASVSSTHLAFGNGQAGTRSIARAVTIANSTNQALNTANVSITGSTGDFSVANTCAPVLSSSANCTVFVMFTPQQPGRRSASIAIPVDGSGTYQSVELTGTGTLDGKFEIANSLTGKVLEVSGGHSFNGALIEESGLNGFAQQHWEFVSLANGYYLIKNALTGRVLDVTGASTINGSLIQQYEYLGNANQQWQLTAVDDVHYKIVNRGSGKVLDLPGGSSADGTPIQQWDFVGNGQQLWVLLPARSYNIANALSSRVADVQSGSGSDGASMQQWALNGLKQQQWQFMPLGGGYYAILNGITGKALDVRGASSANGAAIQQWTYLNGPNQQWQIVPLDDQNYKIINRASGKALDDTNRSLVSGSPLQQWNYEGGTNQQWELIPVTYYTVVNKLSGLALDVPGGSGVEGTPIQQWQPLGNQQQEWQIVPFGGYQTIMNNLTSKVLDIASSSTGNGASVVQASFSGSDTQLWRFVPLAGGSYELLNKRSGKALDLTGASLSNSGSLQQYDFQDGGNQQWLILPVPND